MNRFGRQNDLEEAFKFNSQLQYFFIANHDMSKFQTDNIATQQFTIECLDWAITYAVNLAFFNFNLTWQQ